MQLKKNQGFTLIEVLVAVLIFAIGMLGLAGLQLRAHQSSSFAHGRTVATLSASSLVERMRANLNGVNAGDYAFDSNDVPDAVPACNQLAGCGTDALQAQNDLREWLFELNNSLPILNAAGGQIVGSADIQVCQDGTPETQSGTAIACDGDATQWTIYIDWTDNRKEGAAINNRYTLTFEP